MNRRLRYAWCALWLVAGPAAAAGMKLERERLLNLEGPETVGQFKARFDFQHNFKDYTLLPVADLTLIFGVWRTVQLEARTLLHNSDTTVNGSRNLFQFNVTEYGIKWAPLDQSQEDRFSLAVGGALGRSDIKNVQAPPSSSTQPAFRQKYHLNNRTAWAVAHYDLLWFAQYVSVRWVSYEDSRTSPTVKKVNTVVTPGVGERIKILERRDLRVHLVGDFQFRSFDNRFSANAWGAGVQMMYKSPHIYSFFVSNTHGDTGAESVFGSRSFLPGPRFREQERFFNFRWSYRF